MVRYIQQVNFSRKLLVVLGNATTGDPIPCDACTLGLKRIVHFDIRIFFNFQINSNFQMNSLIDLLFKGRVICFYSCFAIQAGC